MALRPGIFLNVWKIQRNLRKFGMFSGGTRGAQLDFSLVIVSVVSGAKRFSAQKYLPPTTEVAGK